MLRLPLRHHICAETTPLVRWIERISCLFIIQDAKLKAEPNKSLYFSSPLARRTIWSKFSWPLSGSGCLHKLAVRTVLHQKDSGLNKWQLLLLSSRFYSCGGWYNNISCLPSKPGRSSKNGGECTLVLYGKYQVHLAKGRSFQRAFVGRLNENAFSGYLTTEDRNKKMVWCSVCSKSLDPLKSLSFVFQCPLKKP